jgi:hypothetical protein
MCSGFQTPTHGQGFNVSPVVCYNCLSFTIKSGIHYIAVKMAENDNTDKY